MGTTTKLTSTSVKRYTRVAPLQQINIPNRIEGRNFAEAVQAMEVRVTDVERRLEELEARMAEMRREWFGDL